MPTQLGKHFWPDFAFVYGIRIDYLSPTVYLTDILVALIFLFFILEGVFGEKIHDFKTSIVKNKTTLLLTFVFFLLLILGITYSKNQYAGVYGLIKFLEYVFLFSYTANNFRKINVSVFISCFVFGVVFESFLSIFQYFNQGSLGGFLYFLGERAFNSQTPGIANASINGQLFLRPYGTFSHPNILAGYLISAIIVILAFAHKSFLAKQKLIVLSIFLLSSFAVVLSMSRTVIIALLLIVVILVVRSFWKKTRITAKKKKDLSAFLHKIILLSAITIFILITPLWSRFSQFSFSDQSVSQREQLINDSIIMFKENPIIGVGLNNFLVNLPSVQKNLDEDLYLQPVHNIYLLILSQGGIFIFLLSLFFLLKTYKKIGNKSVEFYLLFFTVLFLGFFDHYFLTLQQGQILLALILGILWSSSKNDAKMKT